MLYILFHPGVRSARGQAGRARHPAASLNRGADDEAVDYDEPIEAEAVVDLEHHRDASGRRNGQTVAAREADFGPSI